MKTVILYHTLICPRCALAKLWLAALLPDFPELTVERVDVLTNRAQAKDAGVRMTPALVSGDHRLSGFILTKGAIRRFLESL
jgi:hypothetical protein